MKSFLQGKRTLEISALRSPTAGAVCVGGPGVAAVPALPAGLSPQVEVVKQGDKIMRIVITCTCGERTEIECLYPPGH